MESSETVAELIDRIKKEVDLDYERYYVSSGTKVLISGEGRYIVVHTILDESLRKQLNEGKTWSLFTLADLHSGTNWSYPVPVMAAGMIDIRELMGVGKHRIKSVTFVKKDAKKRVYKVDDERGYITKLTVYNR